MKKSKNRKYAMMIGSMHLWYYKKGQTFQSSLVQKSIKNSDIEKAFKLLNIHK